MTRKTFFTSGATGGSPASAGASKPQAFLTAAMQRQAVWFGLSLVALAGSMGLAVSSWQQNAAANNKNLRFQELVSKVDYLDEVLTSSARLAATNADPRWQKRYEQYVPQLDQVLGELVQISPTTFKNQPEAVNAANQRLVAMETQALKLVAENRQAEALALLLGKEYEQQKQIYAQGSAATIKTVHQQVRAGIAGTEQMLYFSLGLAALSALISSLIVNNARSLRSSLQEKLAYNLELEESQVKLQASNTEFENQAEQLRQQAQKLSLLEMDARLDNEQLQEDIGHLLDVVSELEAGNLQASADVNDRATGLISDTLNRLIEELGKVISQVLTSAQRVASTSTTLEQTAQTLSDYASQQNQGATQVLQLTKQVQLATQAANQQVTNTNQSVGRMAAAVEVGRQDLAGMNQSIGVLQQGAEQIIQQMKTLGEFLGLADQFVQEQTQTVTQTQVLALNATLVAARASEQRDPRQFAMVAREFEKIAAQVSTLSQQTNDSLAQLERRTANIHKAVTAIDTEIQGLGGLVQGFTAGVSSSNQSFDQVKAVVTEVLSASEALTRSNGRIVDATRNTALAMGQMAEFAQKAAQLSQASQVQAQQVGELSVGLLKRMDYFQLPTALLPGMPEQGQEDASSQLVNESVDELMTLTSESVSELSGGVSVSELFASDSPELEDLTILQDTATPEVGLPETRSGTAVRMGYRPEMEATETPEMPELDILAMEDLTFLQDPATEANLDVEDVENVEVATVSQPDVSAVPI